MKTPRVLLIALASMVSLMACTTMHLPAPELPSPESRLSHDWLSSASCIRSGKFTVYYYGTARRTEGAPSRPWIGTITGDILVLSPTNAVACPSGTVLLGAGSRISIKGPHRTRITETGKVPWKHLLSK